MSGYRFCRSDDIPLLVDAYERCYGVHFPDETPFTVADFKRDVRELNLWSSSCMIAFVDDDPIAVVLSGKRETTNLIHRIGVHPDHLRQGHGKHLLNSLSRKLAILGPPRLLAEIPAEWTEICRFFEECGYRPEQRYADFELHEASTPEPAAGAITPATLDDIVAAGAFGDDSARAWERSRATLLNRKEEIHGLAIVSDVRFEAWLIHRSNQAGGTREIVALGHAPDPAGETMLEILVHHFVRQGSEPVVVPRIEEQELRFSLLEAWGFRRTDEYVGMSIMATTD